MIINMLKGKKDEGHDIFARKTNNEMTMLVYTNLKRKKDQLQCTSNQFPDIKKKQNTHKTTKT